MDISTPERYESYNQHDYFDGIHWVERCEYCQELLVEVNNTPETAEAAAAQQALARTGLPVVLS